MSSGGAGQSSYTTIQELLEVMQYTWYKGTPDREVCISDWVNGVGETQLLLI
jgi:hypothetical protein